MNEFFWRNCVIFICVNRVLVVSPQLIKIYDADADGVLLICKHKNLNLVFVRALLLRFEIGKETLPTKWTVRIPFWWSTSRPDMKINTAKSKYPSRHNYVVSTTFQQQLRRDNVTTLKNSWKRKSNQRWTISTWKQRCLKDKTCTCLHENLTSTSAPAKPDWTRGQKYIAGIQKGGNI